MDKVTITFEEYNQLLKIVFCSENFLDTKNDLTEQRLKNYITEFNNLNR